MALKYSICIQSARLRCNHSHCRTFSQLLKSSLIVIGGAATAGAFKLYFQPKLVANERIKKGLNQMLIGNTKDIKNNNNQRIERQNLKNIEFLGIQEQSNQFVSLKNAYTHLKYTYQQLRIDYDNLHLKLKSVENNNNYLTKNNQRLSNANTALETQIQQAQNYLKIARVHNDSLNSELAQFRKVNAHNKVNQGNFKSLCPSLITPSLVIQDFAKKDVISEAQLSSYLNPSTLRQLEHENRQLMYHIQQYQSSILYKNSQIQKLKIQLQSKQIQVLSLRRQIQTFINRQRIIKEEQKRTRNDINQYALQVGSIPLLKQEIRKLKVNNQKLEVNLKQVSQGKEKKVSSYQSKIEQLAQTNQNYLNRIKELQEINNYQSRLQFVQQYINPEKFSKVVKTYIGGNSEENPIQNNTNYLNSTNNQGLQNLYRNINHLPNQTQTNNYNAGNQLAYRLMDGVYRDKNQNNPSNHIFNQGTQNLQSQNNKPSTLAYKLATNLQKVQPESSYEKGHAMLYDKGLKHTHLLPINQNAFNHTQNRYNHPQLQLNAQQIHNQKQSNLKIQSEAFYDFAKQYSQIPNEKSSYPVNLNQNVPSNFSKYVPPGKNDQLNNGMRPESPQIINQVSIERQISKNFHRISPNYQHLSKSSIEPYRQSDFILEYPQPLFNNLQRQNQFVRDQNQIMMQSSKYQRSNLPQLERQSKSIQNYSKSSHILAKKNNESASFQNQPASLLNFQRRIIELATENNSLRKYLTKQANRN